jgi:hypothetical protein
MRNAQELAGRERGQITKIKQQRATAKPEVDEQSWIGTRLVHQTRLNQPGHAACVASVRLRAETNMISAHSLRITSNTTVGFPAVVAFADRKLVVGHCFDVVDRDSGHNSNSGHKSMLIDLVHLKANIGVIVRCGAAEEFRQPIDEQRLAVRRCDYDALPPLRFRFNKLEQIGHHAASSIDEHLRQCGAARTQPDVGRMF